MSQRLFKVVTDFCLREEDRGRCFHVGRLLILNSLTRCSALKEWMNEVKEVEREEEKRKTEHTCSSSSSKTKYM